jgi:hypothetical protein
LNLHKALLGSAGPEGQRTGSMQMNIRTLWILLDERPGQLKIFVPPSARL